MFEEMKEEVHDWKDDEEISRYLARLLNKDAFDHAGLIYGVGHAVYSKSDPRAVIFKGFVERLSEENVCFKHGLRYAIQRHIRPFLKLCLRAFAMIFIKCASFLLFTLG